MVTTIVIAAIVGIVSLGISVGIFFPDSLNLNRDYSEIYLNQFQTYDVNEICEFSKLFFSLEIGRNMPTSQEEMKEQYPEEYAIITNYRGSTDSQITQYNYMLASGNIPDELMGAMVSLVLKSNSINPNLEPIVRDMIYSSSAGKSNQWGEKFVMQLKKDGIECSEDSDPLEQAMNEFSNVKPIEKVNAPITTVEKILIVGYDARDVNELKTHDGIVMQKNSAGKENNAKEEDERIIIYFKNESIEKITISKFMFGGLYYNFQGTFETIDGYSGTVPKQGNFVILSDGKSGLIQPSAEIQPAQTVSIVFDLQDPIRIGRDTQFRLLTTNDTGLVGTIIVGELQETIPDTQMQYKN